MQAKPPVTGCALAPSRCSWALAFLCSMMGCTEATGDSSPLDSSSESSGGGGAADVSSGSGAMTAGGAPATTSGGGTSAATDENTTVGATAAVGSGNAATTTGGAGGMAGGASAGTITGGENTSTDGGRAGGAGQAGAMGADEAAPGGESEEEPQTTVDVSGTWGMFVFEDPVVVDLTQSESDAGLSGTGCCAPSLEGDQQLCCGSIAGSIDGIHAVFGFTLVDVTASYITDVHVSEDGSRMAGTFGINQAPRDDGFRVAWLRVEQGDLWLPRNEDVTGDVLPASVSFELAASGAGGDGFVAGETYAVRSNRGAMYGDFGAFWTTEISIRSEDDAILLGPVPATHPELPVSVVMQRDGFEVLDAVVTMPSGETHTFDAVMTQ